MYITYYILGVRVTILFDLFKKPMHSTDDDENGYNQLFENVLINVPALPADTGVPSEEETAKIRLGIDNIMLQDAKISAVAVCLSTSTRSARPAATS